MNKQQTIVQQLALLLLSFVIIIPAYSQDNKDDDELPSEKIEVVKDYTPNLADAEKIKFQPELPEIDKEATRLRYDVPVKLLNLSYKPPELKPMAISKEKPEPFRSSYVKAGFGTQITPYVEAVYNTGEYEKYHFGASVFHMSSRSSKVEHKDFSDYAASVFGSYYFDQIKLSSELSFDLNNVHYYGYNDEDTSFSKDNIKQRFTTLNWTTELKNTTSNDAKIDHYTKIDPYYRTAKSGEKEFGITAHEEITKRFENTHFTTLTLDEDFTSLTRNSSTQQNNIFSVKASYTFNDENWHLMAGLKGTWEGKTFHFLPTFGAERKLVDDKIIYYNGLEMWIEKNTLRSFSDKNPFIGQNITYKNSRVEDRFTGFKGTVLKGLTYDIRFSSKEISNQPFFVNDTTDMKTFDVVYDDLNDFGIINLHGEVSYALSERLKLTLLGDYYRYYLADEDRPWHKPSYRINLTGQYKIGDKIRLTADIFGIDGTWARQPDGDEKRLNGTIDINIGGEYQFSDLFSAWVQLNNIAHIKHQRWNRYRTYGFNGMIGAKVNF